MLDFHQLRQFCGVKIQFLNPGIKCLPALICLTWLNVTHAQQTPPNFVPSPSSRPTTSGNTDAYTLGPGDLLRVDILDVPEYSGEYLILNDGSLSMPLIGRLNVAGLTVSQLTNLITTEYTPFVQQPFATVSLLSPRPLSVVVAGEVVRPGTYVIPLLVPNSNTRQFQFYKVTQLLQQAGGVTQLADISQIQIRRINPSQQLITVNLKDLLEQGNINQDIILRDGDTILVPKAETLNPIAIRQLTSASFAAQEIDPFSVVIVGEVFNPGTHQVGDTARASSQPPTITQAIQTAGGITPRANIREIKLRRLTNDGKEEIMTINLWELLTEGDITQDVALQPGDSITIPQASNVDPTEVTSLARASFSPRTIQVNVVGEVIRPGAVDVPPDTTLNQAILAAGGFDQRRANKDTVELIRLNPNGTVSRRNIPINLEAGINEATNPILKRDDVIIVNRSGGARFGDSLEDTLKPFGGIIGISSVLNVIQFWTNR
ncbi:MAG: polysaccharide biosynthesis/export family protein [Lyngbya sp.]|nr:polysaccharide biosynthesis/export family protein [Lyngbya sp.]